MADYLDYTPRSSLQWTGSGITVTRTIYIRAEDEIAVIYDSDCPQRGESLDVGFGSLSNYIYCQDVSVSPIAEAAGDASNDLLFEVTAKYGPISGSNPTVNKARWSISFRPQSYLLRNVKDEADQTHYGNPDLGAGVYAWPPITTGINVGQEGAEGVEIDEMVEVLTIEFWKDPDDVEAFLDDIRGLKGKVNNAAFVGPWGTYAEGEARLTGIDVSTTVGEISSVTVEISISANASNVDIWLDSNQNTVSVTKEGWQYSWVRFLKSNVTDETDIKPLSIDAHVATVYDKGDFADLGITGGIWA